MPSQKPRTSLTSRCFLPFVLLASLSANAGEDAARNPPCSVLADKRLKAPLTAIAAAYERHSGTRIALRLLPVAEIDALIEKKRTGADVVLCMANEPRGKTSLSALPGVAEVAWKYPTWETVCAVAIGKHARAADFVRYTGGPTGHRLWSESKAGFTIIAHQSSRAYEWVVENRTKHTYPMTAMRMMGELGGIRDGLCIDIGCGPGHLELELVKRSKFKIIGLDIDAGAKPLFEERMRKAGLADRVSFVLGDAQELPFEDDSADAVISRGTLIFIPDIAKCLREVHRVLKPTGVAFLGGRYLYAPGPDRITTEKLRKIVRESGVPGAKVIDSNGQWVKIVGPKAPKAAHGSGVGPHMLAGKIIVTHGITKGDALLICGSDGGLQKALQRGFVGLTELELTALYKDAKTATEAARRIEGAEHADRLRCVVGDVKTLPFPDASFDLVAGVGPILHFAKDKAGAMRELYRVLRPGGVAFVGGRFLGMPDRIKVPSAKFREIAESTGIPTIRVLDDGGQWVEIRKPTSVAGDE